MSEGKYYKTETFEEGKYYKTPENDSEVLYIRKIKIYYIDVGFFKKKKAMKMAMSVMYIDTKTGYVIESKEVTQSSIFELHTPHTISELYKKDKWEPTDYKTKCQCQVTRKGI